MMLRIPSAINPLRAEHFGEIIKAIHNQEAPAPHRVTRPSWQNIDGHRVSVAYCLDDDAYSGWTVDDRLVGIDINTEDDSVFVETFLFRRQEPTLVRYRAAPIHHLIEKVVVMNGTPSLPAGITDTEKLQYWHALNDVAVNLMGSDIASKRKESLLYKAFSGSSFIVQYLTEIGMSKS